MPVVVRGQLVGISSFLQPYGSWELISGCLATPCSLSHLVSPFLFMGGQFSYVALVSLKFNM